MPPVDPKHPGLSKKDIHRQAMNKLRAYVARLEKDERALPAKPPARTTVSMPLVAEEAGVNPCHVLTRGSEGRAIIEDAIPKLRIEVRVGRLAAGQSLGELMETAIAARRLELEAEGYPVAPVLQKIRQAFYAVSRRDPAGLRADGRAALAKALELAATGEFKIRRELLAELELFAARPKAVHEDGLPADLAGALTVACRRADMSLSELARRAGSKTQTLINWANGTKNPDRRNEPIIEQCERILDLEPGTLTSRIRRLRAGLGRLAADLFPPDLRGDDSRRARAEISALLPDDIRSREEPERYRIINTIRQHLAGQQDKRHRRGRLLKMPYAAKAWGEKAEAQWERLLKHKQNIVATPGIPNGRLWSDGTRMKWRQHFSCLIGFATSEHAGEYRIADNAFGFEALKDARLVHAYVQFKSKRAAIAHRKSNVTSNDVDLMTTCASLFGSSGFIRHDRDIRALLGHADSKDADWDRFCRDIRLAYKELEGDLRCKAERATELHASVKAILDLPRPLTAVKLLVDRLTAAWEACRPGSRERAQALQDLVWTQIQAQAPLRPATWARLEYRPGNLGHLKRDETGWYLALPRDLFKNSRSKALQNDYFRRLIDWRGLYSQLDDWVSSERYLLLGQLKTPLLVLYGYDYIDRDLKLPPDEQGQQEFIANWGRALPQRVRAFTARHLGYNPVTRAGVEGIHALSPTDFRDILATSVVKATGNFLLAADAIADGLEITVKHYMHYPPEDRREAYECVTANLFHAAETTTPQVPLLITDQLFR